MRGSLALLTLRVRTVPDAFVAGALALGLFLVPGCTSEAGESATTVADDGSRVVLAVNGPLACMARDIVGDAAEVEYPGPSDEDPADWRPGVDALRAFQHADLILLNGAGYAKWTASASLPGSRMVDTSTAFADRLIHEASVVHAHGTEGEHHHAGGTAYTTWLDLQQAADHASAIHEAIVAKWPDLKDDAGVRHQALRSAILDLHDAYRTTLQDVDVPLMASHPVYQYLARAYDLEIHSVHWEPGVQPDDHGWADFEMIFQEHDVSVMLWEGSPHPEVEALLAELGITCVIIDPAGAGDDFLGTMAANLERLAAALN